MIDIKSTFLKLTSKRYPNGKESQVIDLLPEFKFEKDEIGNYYIIVPKKDGSFSDTMFTNHIDTVDRNKFVTSTYDWDNRKWNSATSKWDVIDPEKEKEKEKKKSDENIINHVIDDDFIKTDGNSNLGADDKAGTVIMLNMISEEIPGLYYFFIGEESGCIGSSGMSRKYKDLVKNGQLPSVKKCVAFDRRGYGSVITHQMSSRCCSDEFGTELSKQLNEFGFWYSNDSTGVYTDSAEFIDVIPECTNLSVGYFDEHSLSEKQDIEFLELLSKVLLKVNWEILPIVRSIDNCIYTGKKSKITTYGGRYNYYDDDYSGYNYNRYGNDTTTKKIDTTPVTPPNSSSRTDENEFDFDKWYNEQKSKSIIFNE
jgi:hypothetical protein